MDHKQAALTNVVNAIILAATSIATMDVQAIISGCISYQALLLSNLVTTA
jgi:hypothetical protein